MDGPPPPGKTYSASATAVLAELWTLWSIAFIFVCVRFSIRWRFYHKIDVDDWFALLAVIFLLASGSIGTHSLPGAVIIEQVQFGQIHPPPPNFEQLTATYTHEALGLAYMGFLSTWSVKAAFLAFYYKLTNQLRPWRRAWWVITIFTGLTLVGNFISYGLLETSITDNTRVDFRDQNLYYEFSVDVATDLCITALPLALAYRSNVGTKRKISLTFVFSLGLLSTLFSIIRYVMCFPKASHNYGPTWLALWSSTQASVAAIAASLASFRTLAVNEKRRRQQLTNAYNTKAGSNGSSSGNGSHGTSKAKNGGYSSAGGSSQTSSALGGGRKLQNEKRMFDDSILEAGSDEEVEMQPVQSPIGVARGGHDIETGLPPSSAHSNGNNRTWLRMTPENGRHADDKESLEVELLDPRHQQQFQEQEHEHDGFTSAPPSTTGNVTPPSAAYHAGTPPPVPMWNRMHAVHH